MTSALVFPLPAVSDESLWECRTAGGDLGTDGVGGEDAPVLFSSPDRPAGAETNGIDGRREEDRAATGPQKERSPVEEAGHEVEEAEDEELGSTVEEGEEAALALGVLSPEPDLPWLPVRRVSVDCSEEVPQPCGSQDDGSGDEREEPSIPTTETPETEVSCSRESAVTQTSLI